jgi:signal transduction histidine kinase
VPTNQVDPLQKAYASNERQLGIINDLLRVAQLDAGKVKLNKQKADIVPLLRKIMADHESQFAAKHQVAIFHGPKAGAVVPIDMDRMLMAFENLIDNACKYSPEQTQITVEVKARKNEVDIKFVDQGIGIRKKDIPRLFQKFSRLEDPLMSEVSGNGLGLYWANKIILLHNGRMEIDSKPKRGSTFTVTLPKFEKETE